MCCACSRIGASLVSLWVRTRGVGGLPSLVRGVCGVRWVGPVTATKALA
jgi:hypothetical protein